MVDLVEDIPITLAISTVTIYFINNEYAGLPYDLLQLTQENWDETSVNYQMGYTWKFQTNTSPWRTVKQVLEQCYNIFNDQAECNRLVQNQQILKNTHHCTRFHNLSINDVVQINGQFYRCTYHNWKILNHIPMYTTQLE
jgi:hypothetical protein